MSATAHRVPHSHPMSLVLYRACGAPLCQWFYPAPTVPPHVQCAKLVPICPGVTPTHIFPTAGLENLELLVHPPRIEHPITIQRPNVDYREVQGKQG